MSSFIKLPLNINSNKNKVNSKKMLARALEHFSSDDNSSSSLHDTPSAVVILPAPPYTAFQQNSHKRLKNPGVIGPLPRHNPLNASTATLVNVELFSSEPFPNIKRPISNNLSQLSNMTDILLSESDSLSRNYSPEEWRIRLRNGILSTALFKSDRSHSLSAITPPKTMDSSTFKSSSTSHKFQPSKSMSNFMHEDPEEYRTGIIGKSLSKSLQQNRIRPTTSLDYITNSNEGTANQKKGKKFLSFSVFTPLLQLKIFFCFLKYELN